MKYVLKSMSLSEILDTAMSLLQNRFSVLMRISAYAMIPLQLVANLVILAMMPAQPAANASQEALMAFFVSLIPAMIVQCIFAFFLLVFVLPVTEAAIIHAIGSEYLGKPASAGECIKIGVSRFGALIGTGILKSLIVGGSFFLLIVPAIYFWYKYSFWNEIVVIEEKSGMDALNRSGQLMSDNYGTAFVLGIIMLFVYFFVGAISSFIPSAAGQAIVQVLVSTVVSTYAIAVYVVFYFSCRCKLENFDLTMLAHAVGAEAPAVEVIPGAPPTDSLPQ